MSENAPRPRFDPATISRLRERAEALVQVGFFGQLKAAFDAASAELSNFEFPRGQVSIMSPEDIEYVGRVIDRDLMAATSVDVIIGEVQAWYDREVMRARIGGQAAQTVPNLPADGELNEVIKHLNPKARQMVVALWRKGPQPRSDVWSLVWGDRPYREETIKAQVRRTNDELSNLPPEIEGSYTILSADGGKLELITGK